MKKFMSALICAVICVLGMAGCGGSGELDMGSASRQLVSAGIFDEELAEVSASVTEKRLALNGEDIEECTAYAGTKAVVDEIVIIKAVDADAAENVKTAFDKHIETQKKSYESYRPDEVPKLEDAVVTVSGNYAVLVVSKDSTKAQKIIKDCTK